MKRKFSLFLNVAVLALCVCAIAIGVYSAKQASLSVTGTVGFKAHNCELQVSGTKKGYAINEAGTTYQESAEPITIDSDDTPNVGVVSTSGTAGSISTLPIGNLKFTDLATDKVEPIVITLTFTNLSAYQVSATILVDDIANVKYTKMYVMGDGSSLTGLTGHDEAVILGDSNADNKTATFEITLRVADPSKDVPDLSNLNITANFAKYDASTMPNTYTDEQNMEYTLDSNKKSYTLSDGASASGAVITVPQFINNLPVTSIGADAFDNCDSLTSITIPNSVISIGGWAFVDCSSLGSITIPSSVGVIGQSAFGNCSSLGSITISEGLQIIDEGAFSNCNLTSITIPNTVNIIGIEALGGNQNLTTIIFGNNSKLYSIGEYAFSDCAHLVSITLPSNLGVIGSSAFKYCTSLGSINIPSRVTNIGYGAFHECSNLTNVTFEETTSWYVGDSENATTTPLNSTDLANTSTAATFLVSDSPTGYLHKYWTRDV